MTGREPGDPEEQSTLDAQPPTSDVQAAPERGPKGLFQPGNQIGLATRFKPGNRAGVGHGGGAAARMARQLEALMTTQFKDGLPPKWRKDIAKSLGVQPHELADMTLEQIILAQLAKRGAEGDLAFMKELFDRVWPKTRRVEVDAQHEHKVEVTKVQETMDVTEASSVYEKLRKG